MILVYKINSQPIFSKVAFILKKMKELRNQKCGMWLVVGASLRHCCHLVTANLKDRLCECIAHQFPDIPNFPRPVSKDLSM